MQGITFIPNTKNVGFAKANNQGLRIAKGNYILLLNSDTEIHEDSIQTMLRFMDGHLQAGASTCRLDLTTGVMDPACHRGFPTPWAAFTYLTAEDDTEKVHRATKTLTFAAVAIVVALVAKGFPYLIMSIFQNSTTNSPFDCGG